jgi:hypothetical protein
MGIETVVMGLLTTFSVPAGLIGCSFSCGLKAALTYSLFEGALVWRHLAWPGFFLGTFFICFNL